MSDTSSTSQKIHQILEDVFGYKHFREPQETIITHTLEGKNSLVIMPTGGGKSLCFQIPALAMEGLVVVISPLIALMKDQVEALRANGVEVGAINSSLSREEQQLIEQKIDNGILKLLYVSPEKAVSSYFLSYISRKKVSLIAIDEAHCVSVWGNDFRPEYAQLNRLIQLFDNVPVMALTATADNATQTDIAEQLKLQNYEAFVSSFERKNIHIEVRPAYKRIEHIIDLAGENRRASGIVYCLSRKSTESVAARLQQKGFNAEFYHARLSVAERNRIQEGFLKDEIPIICATIAFGMGIDKSNVRWVAHYSLPKNVESYYQEIGRSGRDGLPAKAVLFAGFGDVMTFRNMIEDGNAHFQFKKVQTQKLDRIWEFAQATSCRTNFILNYFGEIREAACGHCDNCKYPPQGFDGSVLAQKALSAVARTHQTASVQLLADILRGSMRREITEKNYHEIKTFGAGKDISRPDWIEYITQLLNQGFLQIDYTQNARLKLTELSMPVLKEGKKVKLTTPKIISKKEPFEKRTKSKKAQFNEALYTILEKARFQLAKATGVVPSHIFSDATLKEMAEKRPLLIDDFRQTNGVSNFKFEEYGTIFLQEIRDFVETQIILSNVKGSTYFFTLLKYEAGKSPKEIAKEREVSPTTVFGHLAYLYGKGEDIDLLQFINEKDIETIRPAYQKFQKEERAETAIFFHFKESIPRETIRMAMAWLKRNG